MQVANLPLEPAIECPAAHVQRVTPLLRYVRFPDRLRMHQKTGNTGVCAGQLARDDFAWNVTGNARQRPSSRYATGGSDSAGGVWRKAAR